jgi:cleavage and polyadenylation specificity factor subunit 1
VEEEEEGEEEAKALLRSLRQKGSQGEDEESENDDETDLGVSPELEHDQFEDWAPQTLVATNHQELAGMQKHDPELKTIIDNLKAQAEDTEDLKTTEELKSQAKDYEIVDDLLMKNLNGIKTIEVPIVLRRKMLWLFHNHPLSAHLGVTKMTARLKSIYHWIRMDHDIREWVRGCASCAKAKSLQKKLAGKTKTFNSRGPFEFVHIDTVDLKMSEDGYRYWLTIIDRYTRWIELVPLATRTAEEVAKALFTEWIARYGAPRIILSDNALEFRSKLVTELSKKLGIKSILSP